MTMPSVVDRVQLAADNGAGPLKGWQLAVELTRVICALVILLSVFARDSVRYWLRQADGPVLTYRPAGYRTSLRASSERL
jgi:hypothetical protein